MKKSWFLAAPLALALVTGALPARAQSDAHDPAISPAATAGDPNSDHGEHPAGLYMPMFSTPPKGGLIYNGPALDEC